ncbi:MAG: hypothetical protein IT377_13030 [Polyangiaceae bacterium]|nr:hypothetical protein [Polyangiaceae bacterium]
MRRVEIIIAQAPRLSAIAAVSLLPIVASCGSRSGLQSGSDAGTTGGATGGGGNGGAGGTTSGGGSGGLLIGGTGGVGGSGGSGGAGGYPGCPSYKKLVTFTVDIPPPGVPAEPGQLCAVTVEPVESNTAARVTLTKYSPALELAQGFVALPPDIEKVVVGVPKISIKAADMSVLAQGKVSNVTQLAGGFSFHLTWPGPLKLDPEPYVRLVMQVELDIACNEPGGDLRTITSVTEIHLCIGDEDLEWVSSGDECTACKTIAEMAPTPILPDQQADALPLARAFRLRVVELARAGNAALLLAENDAGPDAEYQWHASAGRLEQLAPDLVLWTTESAELPHLLQVAVEHPDGAAVASFDWEPL